MNSRMAVIPRLASKATATLHNARSRRRFDFADTSLTSWNELSPPPVVQASAEGSRNAFHPRSRRAPMLTASISLALVGASIRPAGFSVPHLPGAFGLASLTPRVGAGSGAARRTTTRVEQASLPSAACVSVELWADRRYHRLLAEHILHFTEQGTGFGTILNLTHTI